MRKNIFLKNTIWTFFIFCIGINFAKSQVVVHKFGPSGGPSGNTYTQAAQSVTFTNTFTNSLSPYSVTMAVTGEQFTGIEGNATLPAYGFGGNITASSNTTPGALAAYISNDGFTKVTGTVANGYFTASYNTPPKTGMTTADYGITSTVLADALLNADGTNKTGYLPTDKVQFADITITFNRPVKNPIIHISGLGNYWYNGALSPAFSHQPSMQYQLLSPYPVTMLSGSPYFALDTTNKIAYNNAQYPGSYTAGTCVQYIPRYAAAGSVMVTGNNITTLTFRIFLKGSETRYSALGGDGSYTGNDTTGSCGATNTNMIASDNQSKWSTTSWIMGDVNNIGVSFETDRYTGTVYNDENQGPVDDGTVTPNKIPGGIYANLVDASGNVLQSVPVNTDGTYVLSEAMEGYDYHVQLSNSQLSVGSVAPTTTTLPPGWMFTNVGSSTLPGNQNGTGATSTAVVAGVNNINFGIWALDSDGDGIPDMDDWDDDNDGILDAVESPGCYYTAAEAGTISGVTSQAPGTTTANTEIASLHDGVTTTGTYKFNSGQTITPGTNLLAVSYPTAVQLTSVTVNQASYGLTGGLGTNWNLAYAQLYGSNGGTPVAISNSVTTLYGATVTFNVTDTTNSYQYYFIKYIGTAATGNTANLTTDTNAGLIYEVSGALNTTNYQPSGHPKSTCTPTDTDGDTIPNNLDLDSDNDGCLDAIEGGANIGAGSLVSSGGTVTVGTGSTASNQNLCGGNTCVDANGVPVLSPTPTGYTNGTGQSIGYSQNGANAISCIDSDGDGLSDDIDLDDDNDGILDAVESPNCFYTLAQATTITTIKSILNGTVAANTEIPSLHNGNTTDGIYHFNNSQTMNPGDALFTIEYPTAIQLQTLAVTSTYGMTGLSGNWFSVTGRLYGSTDGVSYTPISAAAGVALYSSPSFTVTDATNKYRYYQIRYIGDASGGNGNSFTLTNSASYPIQEITATVLPAYSSSYVASANQKPGTCSDDADGDTIPNYLDLDSDNDGCLDAIEGGANIGAGSLVSSGGTVTVGTGSSASNQNLCASSSCVDANGVPTYATPPSGYTNGSGQSLGQSQNAADSLSCIDADGDGLSDNVDWDDDNDGILDAVESPNCFYTLAEATAISSITSTLNGDTGDPTAGSNLPRLYNGTNETTTAAGYNFALPQTINSGQAFFTITYPTAVALQTVTVSEQLFGMSGSGTNWNLAYGQLFGSNDGTSYTAISNSALVYTNQTYTLTSTTPYKYYQIRYIGTAAAGNSTPLTIMTSAAAIGEITPTILSSFSSSYVPSANQKPGTCSDDADGDGIPNYLDLDSDNDGCLDAMEGGANITFNMLVNSGGTVSVGTGSTASNQNLCASGSCVDANGVPTYATPPTGYTNGSGQTLGQSQNASDKTSCDDWDGDGVPDDIDLDDDNDGILDTDEGLNCNSSTFTCGNQASCTASFPLANRVVWTATSGSQYNGQVTVGTTTYNVVATTTTTFAGLLSNSWQFGSGTYSGCPDASTSVANTAVNHYSSNYTVTMTFDKPVTNPVLVFSSFNGSGVTFNQTVCVVGIQGNINGYQIGDQITSYPPSENIIAVAYTGTHTSITYTVNGSDLQGAVIVYLSNSSANPAGTCTARDTDGDGIPDYLDLDSDNDGCVDAIEGGASITTSQLVSAGGLATVGSGSSASNQNLCGGTTCVDANGVPVLTPAPTGYTNGSGQSVGSSANTAVQDPNCIVPAFCYKPAVTTGTVLDSPMGITSLSRAGSQNADNWPMVRKGAWTVLEARTKGFVVNRVAFSGGNPVGIATTNFVEGMLVYDTTNNCLKIYTSTDGGTTFGWYCISAQACPD